MITIDLFDDDRMIVRIPWHNGMSRDLAKRVHGGRWNKARNGWTYPRTWQICKEIRQYIAVPLNETIRLEPAMKAWAEEEHRRQQKVPSLLSVEGVELPNLARTNPRLHKAVCLDRPFQSRSIAFGVMEKRILIAHDPGLGKTLQAIGMMHEANVTGLILVIGPSAAVNISWPSLLAEWAPDDYVQQIGTNIRPSEREDTIQDLQAWAEENPTERCWVLMNPHWIRMQAELDEYGKYIYADRGVKLLTAELPALFDVEWSSIIVDESHQTLACSSGNAKKWSKQRQGLGALQHRKDAILMSISGTPMRGKPENLYGQLNWLRPEIYRGFWKWVDRHFVLFEDDQGRRVSDGLKSEKKFFEEASNVMYRVTKEQVAADLPPKMYGGTHLVPGDPTTVLGVWLPLTPTQAKSYRQMTSTMEAELEGHVMKTRWELAKITRLKQFAGSSVKFSHFTDRKLENTAWRDWQRKRLENAELSELKEQLREEGNDGAADTIDILEIGEEPERWVRDEDDEIVTVKDEPIYEATLPSNKFDWILQFLVDRDLVGKEASGKTKVILASQFTKLLNLFSKELEKRDCPNYLLTGETKMQDRRKMVHEFQNNPDSAKVFFLNTYAGGTALTLDQADDVIIIDETFNPDDQLQVEDRAHRLSNTEHQVTVWYLRSLGTIEEYIGETTAKRESVCLGIMDGSRGIDLKKLIVPSKE